MIRRSVYYNSAIALDSTISDAYNNNGLVHFRIGKYEEAIKNFNKSSELNGDNHLTHFYNAESMVNIGDYKNAIEEYTQSNWN